MLLAVQITIQCYAPKPIMGLKRMPKTEYFLLILDLSLNHVNSQCIIVLVVMASVGLLRFVWGFVGV